SPARGRSSSARAGTSRRSSIRRETRRPSTSWGLRSWTPIRRSGVGLPRRAREAGGSTGGRGSRNGRARAGLLLGTWEATRIPRLRPPPVDMFTRGPMADARFVEVDGLRLRVSIRGSGPPLLLLNGIGASLELLEQFRQAIHGHETIALDLPGVGLSQTSVLPMRFRGYARLVAGALGVLRYGQIDVLGVSWGGALAQEFAWRHAAHVRRLVLAATTYGVPSVIGSPRALWELATPRRYMSRSHF